MRQVIEHRSLLVNSHAARFQQPGQPAHEFCRVKTGACRVKAGADGARCAAHTRLIPEFELVDSEYRCLSDLGSRREQLRGGARERHGSASREVALDALGSSDTADLANRLDHCQPHRDRGVQAVPAFQ